MVCAEMDEGTLVKEKAMDEKEMDLEQALKTIRETCKKQSNCRACPLRRKELKASEENCMITDKIPESWELKSDENTDNRLFV